MALNNFALNLGGGTSGGATGLTSLAFDPTATATPGPPPLFDEFNWETNAAPRGDFAWIRYAAGTGAAHVDVAPTSSETNRYGIHQFTPSTTASVPGGLYSQNARSVYPGGMGLEYAFSIQVGKVFDATDDWIYVGGFQDTTNILPANGVFIIADRSVSANWQIRCRKASTNTTVDTGIAVSTSWTNFRIVINSNWTSVQAYINGSAAGSAVTTNIPDAQALGPQLYMYRVAGTAATTNWKGDWAYLKYTLGSARGGF